MPAPVVMSLPAKLQLKDAKVRVLNAPQGFEVDVPTTDDAEAAAVLFVVRSSKDLEGRAMKAFVAAAKDDRLAWLAYPKAMQLGTDVNRDILWDLTKPHRIRPVRQVSIDATWSALRF